MRAAAELGLHADHQIEQLFPLNDLSDRLPAHRGRDHGLYIGDVDSIACDLAAIDVDQQARLAKFAHDRKLGETRHLGQRVLDLNRLVLKNIQIVAIDLDCQ